MINFDDLEFGSGMNSINISDNVPKWPFRGLIVGPSGCGKTNLLLNILLTSIKFDRLIVFAGDILESKYQILEKYCENLKELDEDFEYYFTNSLEEVPDVDDFEQDKETKQTMIVFDDFITAANQKMIEEIYVRGRKKNISSIYLAQDYTKIPKTIRKNVTFLVLFPIQNKTAIKSLASMIGDKFDYKDFQDIFKELIKLDYNEKFLIFDTTQKDPDKQWRYGFEFDNFIIKD